MIWNWQLNPAVCHCQMCQQWRKDEEVKRVQRVLDYFYGGK